MPLGPGRIGAWRGSFWQAHAECELTKSSSDYRKSWAVHGRAPFARAAASLDRRRRSLPASSIPPDYVASEAGFKHRDKALLTLERDRTLGWGHPARQSRQDALPSTEQGIIESDRAARRLAGSRLTLEDTGASRQCRPLPRGSSRRGQRFASRPVTRLLFLPQARFLVRRAFPWRRRLTEDEFRNEAGERAHVVF